MSRLRRAVLLSLLPVLLLCSWPYGQGQACAGERLILIGGGTPPEEAIQRLFDWSKDPEPRILVITWATAVPERYLEMLRCRVKPYLRDPREIDSVLEEAPRSQEMLTDAGRNRFLRQLDGSTALFLSGGDQNKFMDVLRSRSRGRVSTDVITAGILEKYRRGMPIVGTSAGAMLLSRVMITGDGDDDKLGGKGLGLLSNVIADTHFITRHREPRLKFLMKREHMRFGLGIDEGCAVCIENGNKLTALGNLMPPGREGVIILDQESGKPTRRALNRGETFLFNAPTSP